MYSTHVNFMLTKNILFDWEENTRCYSTVVCGSTRRCGEHGRVLQGNYPVGGFISNITAHFDRSDMPD